MTWPSGGSIGGCTVIPTDRCCASRIWKNHNYRYVMLEEEWCDVPCRSAAFAICPHGLVIKPTRLKNNKARTKPASEWVARVVLVRTVTAWLSLQRVSTVVGPVCRGPRKYVQDVSLRIAYGIKSIDMRVSSKNLRIPEVGYPIYLCSLPEQGVSKSSTPSLAHSSAPKPLDTKGTGGTEQWVHTIFTYVKK